MPLEDRSAAADKKVEDVDSAAGLNGNANCYRDQRMISPEIRDQILSIDELGTFPQTLSEILRVCDSPDATTYDLSRIILKDPPTAARLMRIANSELYGRCGQVTTVHESVVLLGFRSVKSLVLSTAIHSVFDDEGTSPAFDLRRFWQHCVETAGIAQLLASRIGHQPQEEAFVAGLLHDLGLLIMARAFGSQYGAFVAAATPDDDWCAAERRLFGIDHQQAAELLFAKWGLPDAFVEAAAHHHDSILAEDGPRYGKLTLIVALADTIGHQGIESRPSVSRAQLEEKHHLMAVLGVRSSDLENVDRWVAENLSALAAHMDIPVESPVTILARANRELYRISSQMEALFMNSPSAKKDEFARQILDAICATYSHYINNATTTIMGHSELVEVAIRKGQYLDPEGKLIESMKMIERAVCSISAVLHEMKQLREYDVVSYHDRAKILDIEDKVKRRVAAMLRR